MLIAQLRKKKVNNRQRIKKVGLNNLYIGNCDIDTDTGLVLCNIYYFFRVQFLELWLLLFA